MAALTDRGRARIAVQAAERLRDRWGSARGGRKRAILLFALDVGEFASGEASAALNLLNENERSHALSELVDEGYLIRIGHGWYRATDHALTVLAPNPDRGSGHPDRPEGSR